MSEYRNILIDVRGGTGKNFVFAHLLPELKEKYELVSVISPYFDIFQASPYCDKAYNPQEVKSAFEDAEDDTLIVVDHIYDTNEFIRKEISYADAFRKLCGLETKDGEEYMDLSQSLDPEKAFPFLKDMLKHIKEELKKKGYKDFIVAQFTGGQTPLVQVPAKEENGKQVPDWSRVPYTGQQAGLARHYPHDKAQEFIKLFREAHPKTAILHYSLPNEGSYEGVEQYTFPYLLYTLLTQEEDCRGIVAIDSSLQHLAAGNCKGVVLWGHSHPISFGYRHYNNIIQKCNRSGIKYFSALGPAANRIDYIKPAELLKEVDNTLFTE